MPNGLRRPGRGIEIDRLNQKIAHLVDHAADTLFSVGERERVVDTLSQFILRNFILIDEASSMISRARVDELNRIDEYIEDEESMPVDFDPRIVKRHTIVRRTEITAIALRQED